MKVVLIRHGETYGNTKKRYIGVTDESLCKEGIEKIKLNISNKIYPDADVLFSSPLKRCKETATLIYPDKQMIINDALRECNFGEFENKNYEELKDNSHYQEWIDSNGTIPFYNGDDIEEYKGRTISGFLECIRSVSDGKCAAFVVHGGTIMTICECFCNSHKGFYDYNVKNAEGYIAEFDLITKELSLIDSIRSR